MMRNATVMLVVLCSVGLAQADVVIDGADPGAGWHGWVNIFNLDEVSEWASGWETVDLRAAFDGSGVLTLAPNTNAWDPGDPYWVNPDLTANKIMEANFMQVFGDGALAGQNVTFNYVVGTNTLPDDYVARAFIKVLDSDAGGATMQYAWMDLVPGAGSVSLTVDDFPAAYTQVGFSLMGLIADPAGPVAETGVTIIPEPTTLGLLGLGAIMLRRRRK